MTVRCEELERKLQSSASTGAISTFASVRQCYIDDNITPGETSHVFDSQCAEMLASPISSCDLIRTATDKHFSDPVFNTAQRTQFAGAIPFQPPKGQIFELWHIYMTRVEPLTKLVPYAWFEDLLILTAQEAKVPEPGARTLMFSVCFAAVSALTDDEITQQFDEGREALNSRLTVSIQTTLSLPDGLQQPGTRLLQALVLYAVSLHRRLDDDQATFTDAFKLAFHIAGLIGIGKAEDATCPPYDTEIRRRCWWTLCRLWYQCAQKPGWDVEEPIPLSDVPPPLNINDIDLMSVTEEMPKARQGLTQMSLFLVHLEVVRLTGKLELLNRSPNTSENSISIGVRRRNLVEESVRKIERDFLWHCDTSRPFDWFLMLTTKAMLNPIEMMMLDEPEYGSRRSGVLSTQAKEDRKFLLRLDVVECWHMMNTHENLKPWRWFLRNIPEAFSVDDLCADLVRLPQSPYSDRACALIDLISRG
ncbi:uncharacterized protein Z519_07133 [Cladophialophora bantiana CBS 173.52]|uniref:Transcription factor domain-containing protein n=1 Tax=Cladophialophora bantiana (strain ATCC 10958 / CBS 173.52 / CDC B-1940 / NIH 8579) TaxID=1442370 RepID=A0A0D2I5H1_CLAB1|nr:uncharacterized protein Z519_07133 [Cladophialophora bantiana CBS 173.52]KIW92149.1 hypothetical protein Z519_07133 [Cladophialophora bantiana CBS 173.52]